MWRHLLSISFSSADMDLSFDLIAFLKELLCPMTSAEFCVVLISTRWAARDFSKAQAGLDIAGRLRLHTPATTLAHASGELHSTTGE